jgi:hypothetical protein
MARYVRDRAEDFRGEGRPVFREWLHKAAPGFSILTECGLGVGKIAFEGDGRSIVERVGEGCHAVDPVQSVICEWKRGEKGRPHGKRVNGGAEIVAEAGEGEWQRASRSTRLSLGLENFDTKPGLRENDRGSEAVGPGSNDRCLRQ